MAHTTPTFLLEVGRSSSKKVGSSDLNVVVQSEVARVGSHVRVGRVAGLPCQGEEDRAAVEQGKLRKQLRNGC